MDSMALVHNLYAQCKHPTVAEGLQQKQEWCNGGCNTYTPAIGATYLTEWQHIQLVTNAKNKTFFLVSI